MRFFLLFLLGCITLPLLSQSCLPNGITFSNQQSIDNFSANYPGCTTIEGNVFMHGAINNLEGLSQITKIEGRLSIADNPNLNSLSGLDNLTSIGSDLQLQGNGTVDLSGLENLTSIGGSLIIFTHLHLINLSGLDQLSSIGKSIDIELNTKLTNLSGIENITNIKNLVILDNNLLNDLTTLSGINSISGFMKIGNNPQLSSLSGLDNITSTGGYLSIFGNDILSDLSALHNLNAIDGYLLIDNNLALDNISGLQNIHASGIQSNHINHQDLEIHNNPSLSECAIGNVCDILSDPNKTKAIFNNKTNCNSLQEVGQICMPLPCAELMNPINGAVNVHTDTDLSWTPVANALGYKLSIRTETGQTDLLNHLDLGNSTTYVPASFQCGSDVFITITPYNEEGDAISCPEQHFTIENTNANAGSDEQICSGDSIQLQAQGGTAYIWTPSTFLNDANIANPVAHPIATTNYIVRASQAGRCPDTDTITITVNYPALANISAMDESTYNGQNGTAGANPAGGSPPYSYQWSNGAATPTINDLSPILYTLTIVDANGCLSIDSVRIAPFECPEMTIQPSQNNVSCTNQCNGSLLIANVNNAVAPLHYEWNTGDTISNIQNLCAGLYQITITDATNCSIQDEYEITAPTPLLNTITSTSETTNEANDGTATAHPTGGTPPYSYLWSNGATGQSISNLPPAIYHLRLQDANGCTRTDSILIEAYNCADLQIQTTQSNVSCYGLCDGSLQITEIENGAAPFRYLWSTNDTTNAISNLCNGLYQLTITDHNNCSALASYQITQPDTLLNNIVTTDETSYAGNDGTATANPMGGTPPYTFNWSNGENTTTVSHLMPGNYTLGIEDANHCSIMDSLSIAAFICPEWTTNANSSNISCFGACDGKIDIIEINNATPPIHYLWSNGDTVSTLNNLCAGTYSLTITDAKNCSSNDHFFLTAPDSISVSIDSIRNIFSDSPGAIYANTNNNGQYSFTWIGPNGFSANTEDIVQLEEAGCYALTVIDTSTQCQKEISACIAIIESTTHPYLQKTRLYPNPATRDFTLDFGHNSSFEAAISLLDLSGKIIFNTTKNKGEQFIPIHPKKITPGIYIVQIKTYNLGTVNKKIMVVD